MEIGKITKREAPVNRTDAAPVIDALHEAMERAEPGEQVALEIVGTRPELNRLQKQAHRDLQRTGTPEIFRIECQRNPRRIPGEGLTPDDEAYWLVWLEERSQNGE